MEELFEALQKISKPAPRPQLVVTQQQKRLIVEVGSNGISVRERTEIQVSRIRPKEESPERKLLRGLALLSLLASSDSPKEKKYNSSLHRHYLKKQLHKDDEEWKCDSDRGCQMDEMEPHPGEKSYSCRECNFDLCKKCFNKTEEDD